MSKKELAIQWINTWNSHQLDQIMALYHKEASHTSPKVAAFFMLANNTINGKSMLETYFKSALEKNKNLHFDIHHIMEGQQSMVLVYTRNQSELAAEYLEFDEEGLIIKSRSHYAAK